MPHTTTHIDLDKVPSPAPVLQNVLELRKNTEVEYGELERLIKNDPALSVKFLSIANSVEVKRHAAQVHSIQRALMSIGIRRSMSIIVVHALSNIGMERTPGYPMIAQGLWQHSLACACAMNALHILDPAPLEADPYTCGLLLNIGKLALGPILHDRGVAFERMVTQHNVFIDDAEHRILGLNHADVGAKLATKWKLPDAIVRTILLHHRPEHAPDDLKRLTYMAHIADMIATTMDDQSIPYRCHQNWRTYVPINDDVLELIACDVRDHVQQTTQMLAAG